MKKKDCFFGLHLFTFIAFIDNLNASCIIIFNKTMKEHWHVYTKQSFS